MLVSPQCDGGVEFVVLILFIFQVYLHVLLICIHITRDAIEIHCRKELAHHLLLNLSVSLHRA